MAMESLSKQELIATITKQADQIKRYETRLRDVVAAYKGLVKEKEALEISLKALNKTEKPVSDSDAEQDDSVKALTLSLSTLTEEKARMEEAFQADKKITREKYENIITNLRDETKSLVKQHLAELNNLKAKLSYEIQEREKERVDHSAMLKELQQKFTSERISKEKLEDKQANSTENQASALEKRVRDLSGELEAARRRLARAEARRADTPATLRRLTDKMVLLEQTAALGVREEQIKVKRAEEAARKAVARQEQRVAVLESKLAELSQTIGEYDVRRRKDQQTIQTLRDSLNMQLVGQCASDTSYEQNLQKGETDNEKLADSEYLQTIIDKIHILKKELLSENDKLGCPIDIATVFKIDYYENIHYKCKEDYDNLKSEFENYKRVVARRETDLEVSTDVDKFHIQVASLMEKLEDSKKILDIEKKAKIEAIRIIEEKLKSEQDYNKEVVLSLKTRVMSLEKQVQTQRERYSALLEETDHYLRGRARSRGGSVGQDVVPDMTSPPHMLHYAHELARKDLDISQLRKDKHIIEGHLRDSQREATIEKERFKEVIRTLKVEIERLRRIQSREGANLEYLKNVVVSYLLSTDYVGRKHMLNAIAAVLHFTETEIKMVLATL